MTWAFGWQYPPGFLDWVHQKIIDVEHEAFGSISHEGDDYHSAHVVLSYQPGLFHEDPYWRDIADALGRELDVVHEALDSIIEAFYVEHAPEWGLKRWESFVGLPEAPAGISVPDRVASVLAKLVVGPRTVADFQDLIETYFGISASITENYASYSVDFNIYGAPTAEAQEAFEAVLRAFLPAHLDMTVAYGGFIAGVGMAGDTI